MDRPAPSALTAARYALLALACISALAYFTWRIGVMNPAFPVYSWLVFAAELLGFARALAFLLAAVHVTNREPPVAPAGLAVDVFITTFDEPLDIVRRTVGAAIDIRYPHETWLLDDGNREEMRGLAGDLGCRYLARADNTDAKAGNLNHGLALARGAFVAVFDADHVADVRFLDRTLGYFDDANVACVQTAQEFFNFDSFQHLRPQRRTSNNLSFFHRVLQRSRDGSNSTIFSGSSAVLRRRALDEIGGFAVGTVTEDVHTSFRLHAAGWRTVCHAEILAAGIAPTDAKAFSLQRLRWAQGAVQLVRRENVFGGPGLTWSQRQAYFIQVAGNLEGWRHLFIYALPIAILFTGIVPLRTDAATFTLHFAPYFIALMLAYGELTRGHGRFFESAVFNLARAPTSLLAIFTAFGNPRYCVTPKRRVRHRVGSESAFTWSLLVLTLGAIAFALAAAFAGRSPFAAGTLAVVIAWASFHVATATRLLVHAHRCARERRAATRFACNLPAQISRAGDPAARYAVVIAGATADGFTLRTPGDARGPAAQSYEGVLEIGGTRLPFAIALREAGLGGAVEWPDGATRARFDLLLHQQAVAQLASADGGDRGGLWRRGPVASGRLADSPLVTFLAGGPDTFHLTVDAGRPRLFHAGRVGVQPDDREEQHDADRAERASQPQRPR